MSRLTTTWLVLAAIAGAAGCGGSSGKNLLPTRYRGGRPAVDGAVALRFLYPDTALVVVGASPTSLDQKLGWRNLIDLAGVDLPVELTDLAGLEKIGLAVDGGFGVALLEPRAKTWVWFATLRNPEPFTRYLVAESERRGTVLEVSDGAAGTLYLPRDDPHRAVVLRDHVVFYLVTAGARSVRDLAAIRLASTLPGDSLAVDPGFRALFDRLRFGRDLAGYLALDRLTAERLAPTEVDDKLAEFAGRLDASLGLARDRGDPAEILGIEEQVALVTALQKTRDGQRRLVATLVGGLGAVGFGIELEPRAALVELLARPDPRALVHRLLGGPVRTDHRILDTTPAATWLLATLHTDPATLLELFDLLLGSRATSVKQLSAELAELTGEDLAARIAARLDGQLGVVVGAAAEARAESGELTALLGITDPAEVESVFTAIADHEPPVGTFDRDGHLGLPWGSKQLWIGTAGSALVATTEPPAFARIAAPGPARRSDYPTALTTLLGHPATGLLVIAPRVLADLFATPTPNVSPASSLDRVSPAPESADTVRLRDALAEVDQELERGQQERVAADGWLLERRAHLLGTVALAILPNDQSIVGYGGLFLSRPLIEVATGLAATSRRHHTRQATILAALRKLESRRDQLTRDLAASRSRDLESWQQDPDTNSGEEIHRDLGGSPTRPIVPDPTR